MFFSDSSARSPRSRRPLLRIPRARVVAISRSLVLCRVYPLPCIRVDATVVDQTTFAHTRPAIALRISLQSPKFASLPGRPLPFRACRLVTLALPFSLEPRATAIDQRPSALSPAGVPFPLHRPAEPGVSSKVLFLFLIIHIRTSIGLATSRSPEWTEFGPSARYTERPLLVSLPVCDRGECHARLVTCNKS